MKHPKAFNGQDAGTMKMSPRVSQWSVSVIGVAATVMIAGMMLAFSSGEGIAKPGYVTASKPCGSCHPPNKPPKKK